MSEEYYNDALEKGVDYNFYGEWQKMYAKMVISASEVIRRTSKASITCLDVGCGCGVNTRAFKETSVFSKVYGCDVSEYMLELGRKTHDFTEEELFFSPAWDLPTIRSGGIDLIHCSGVLNEIDEGDIRLTIEEFRRILSPKGAAFIVVYNRKSKPIEFWEGHFKTHFREVELNPNTYQTDLHSPHGGTWSEDNQIDTFYQIYSDSWNVFLLSR